MSSYWRQSVLRVLGQYAPEVDLRAWSVRPFASGNQSRLFQAQCFDQSCLRHDTETLVKVYKSQPGMRLVAQNEFRGLELLNMTTQEPAIDGWRFEAPLPLYLCYDPVAIVLTRVNGVMLEKHFCRSGRGPELWIDSLAHAVSRELVQYWRIADCQYGDLNLFNLLCDPEKRIFSLVDPGIPSEIFTCPNVSNAYSPASRDLGYLLFEISTENCQPTTSYFRIARRRNRLVLALIQHYIETNLTPTETDAFVQEVAKCINTHLGRIETRSPIFGAWRSHVRRSAIKNVRRILSACRPKLDPSASASIEHPLLIGPE